MIFFSQNDEYCWFFSIQIAFFSLILHYFFMYIFIFLCVNFLFFTIILFFALGRLHFLKDLLNNDLNERVERIMKFSDDWNVPGVSIRNGIVSLLNGATWSQHFRSRKFQIQIIIKFTFSLENSSHIFFLLQQNCKNRFSYHNFFFTLLYFIFRKIQKFEKLISIYWKLIFAYYFYSMDSEST